MKPYYDEDGITIYHGDWREVPVFWSPASVLVTDPPYGIEYWSGSPRLDGNARGIYGDLDCAERDELLEHWFGIEGVSKDAGPALVFGSWKRARPLGTRGVLIWDKGGALGMGDLSLPWKLDHEEIYILGRGFSGRRDSGSVIRVPPEQSIGRLHPHQKPVQLMTRLLIKTTGAVFDPFMGSGSTLVAAKALGRSAVGVEVEERYCERSAKRLAQRVLNLA